MEFLTTMGATVACCGVLFFLFCAGLVFWYLFNDVVPADQLMDRVRTYATWLAEVSPDSVATTKRQLWDDLLAHDPGASVEHSKALIDQMMQRPDYLEGVAAMRERRPPRFVR